MPRPLDLAQLRAFMTANHPPEQAQRGLYEAAYYNLHGELPPDAVVFERIEWHGNEVTLVHQDHYALRQ